MATYLVLVRGVNVGGLSLKMEDLRRLLEYIGLAKVRTYIQSGNAIFENEAGNKRKLEAEIGYELKNLLGAEVPVFVLSLAELAAIVSAHPLADGGDIDNLYVTVLSERPEQARVDDLLGTMNAVDSHLVSGRTVYSRYGEGYGRSKRSNNFIEKMLKVRATTRNWSTMTALFALAKEKA